MVRPSKMLAALVATSAVVLATACGASGGSGSGSGGVPELTIGQLVPLTGNAIEGSKPQSEAFQLAVDEVNAAGKVKIKVVQADTKSSPEGAVPAFQSAVSQGADLIVQTGAGSPTALAIAAAAGAAKKIHVSANLAQLSSVNPLGFNLLPTGGVQTSLSLEALLEEKPGIKTAVLVAPDNYDLGVGANKARRTLLESKGIQVLAQDTVPGTAADLSANAGKYAAMKPDLLVSDMAEGSSAWAQQVKDAGFAGIEFFGSAVATSTIVSQAPAAYQGAYTYQSWNPAAPDVTAVGKAFAQKFKDRFGHTADGFTAAQYDGVRMIAAAVEATKSTDSKTLADWMKTNTGPEGASMAALKFSAKDQAFSAPIQLVTLDRGNLVPVRSKAAGA